MGLAGGEGTQQLFLVMVLPYELSLGILLKAYSASDPSGCPMASVVEGT